MAANWPRRRRSARRSFCEPRRRCIASAAHALLKNRHLKRIAPELHSARDETFGDVALLKSGKKIPKARQPLDSGFIELPAQLLDEFRRSGASSLVGRIQSAALYFLP